MLSSVEIHTSIALLEATTACGKLWDHEASPDPPPTTSGDQSASLPVKNAVSSETMAIEALWYSVTDAYSALAGPGLLPHSSDNFKATHLAFVGRAMEPTTS